MTEVFTHLYGIGKKIISNFINYLCIDTLFIFGKPTFKLRFVDIFILISTLASDY